jgi:signal transduction histidine kinase
LIGVPLRIGTRTIGVLKVENKKPVKISHFSHNELRGLEVLASNIALALEMRRQQQVFFKKGNRARVFTHGLSNNVQNAQYAVSEAVKEIAHGRGSPSMAMEYLATAEKTLDLMDRLRRRVLEETRAEQGKTTVSINQIMGMVVERCKVLEREGIQLFTEFLEKDVFTSVDQDEVLQGFDMLIENSIDALKDVESPTVWIKAFSEDSPEKTVNVATMVIVDNGSGFTDQQISEFEDKGEITSTKHAGLGMGVNVATRCFADNAVYLRIVEPPRDLTAHGAAFKVDFPLHEPRYLSVLIIDDDDSFSDMAKMKFREVENVNVESQNTYDILLEAISDVDKEDVLRNFDLILLDCYFEDLPLQGPGLLKRIQVANSELANRIVLMSGKVEYQNRSDIFVLNKYKELERFPEGIHDIRRRQS